jgi:hypothetical protein
MTKIKTFGWMLLLAACMPLATNQGPVAQPSSSVLTPQPTPTVQPISSPSVLLPSSTPSPIPVPSLSPIPSATPTARPSFAPISANGLSLAPLENLAEYWGFQLTAEEKKLYGAMYPSCQDSKGNFYFMAYRKIYVFSSLTGKTTYLAGSGQEGELDGAAAQAQINSFNDCSVMPDKTIYFLDPKYLVRKLTTENQMLTLNKQDKMDGYSIFSRNLIFLPKENKFIYSVESLGLKTFVPGEEKIDYFYQQYFSPEKKRYGFRDGALTETALLGSILDVSKSPSDSLYVYDHINRAIRVIEKGIVTTLAGGNPRSGHRDGFGKNAEFLGAGEIFFDPERNSLIVLEYNAIRLIQLPSMRVSTLALPGQDYRKNSILGKILSMYILDKTHWLLYVWPTPEVHGSPSYLLKLTLPEGALPDRMVSPENFSE